MTDTPPEYREALNWLAKKAGRLGGLARAKKLTKKRRVAIATKASKAAKAKRQAVKNGGS